MSDGTRRKIARLRALAASTTFPAEAASARAKADKLEAELGGPHAGDVHGPNARAAPMPDPRSYDDARSYLRAMAEFHQRAQDAVFREMMRGGR